MAVVLALTAAVLLALSAILGPDQPSPLLRVVYVFAQWAGPLLLVMLTARLVWPRVVSWAARQLVELAGPALIRAMPPRAVLGALLPWVYGDAVGHKDVLSGVLGGGGRDPSGRDTAVSRGTTAHFRLWSIDERMCSIESTWTHDFSGIRDNHKLVLFATSDNAIADLVPSERIFPLFELWLLDEDYLLDFVPTLREALEIGVSYTDEHGTVHVAPPRSLPGAEVALRNYEQFIRLTEAVDRKDLHIVEFDLHDLADPDHVVGSIESLSIRTVHNAVNLGFLTWSPPHPCFVRTVAFDVEELALDGQRLVYLVVGSTIKKSGLPLSKQWVEVSDRIEIVVNAWMLPGHNVTLLWRPLDGMESESAVERW
jgi:hypothetical protein